MRPLIPALGASVLAAAAIVWTPLPGPKDVGPGAAAAPPATTGSRDAVTASPAVAYVQFAPQAGGATGAEALKPGPPVLVGLAGAGQARTAYIMDAGQPVRARVGDTVGQWRLAAVGPHSVTLRAAGKSMQLAFYGPRPEPPPAAAPEAAAAPAEPPAAAPAAAPPPVRSHALEPASAPAAPPRAASHARYWAGPPGSAPPGYVVLRPGQAPPQ